MAREEPLAAHFHLLHTGYARDRVASTVSYVADGEQHIVIDPGMVASADRILEPLEELGCAPQHVTDVVLSHWHPDHTWHLALFPNARVHDHWAIYRGDRWDSRPAEGAEVSPSIRLLETPGHTPQDVSTVIDSTEGVVVCTHLWWTSDGPEIDPRATDQAALEANRERVLSLAQLIVPGHGAPFTP